MMRYKYKLIVANSELIFNKKLNELLEEPQETWEIVDGTFQMSDTASVLAVIVRSVWS